MNNHFARPVRWGILLYLWCFCTPLQAQLTVDQFMGVNTRGQDPLVRLQAVGHVREFHPWVFNEGFPTTGNASPAYPNNQYRWNPNYIDYIRFDDFYDEINSYGLSISPVTLRSIPQVVNPFLNINDPNRDVVLAQKPIMGGADPLLPSSYIAHAAYLYQYAARYGKTAFSSNKLDVLIAPRLAPDEVAITGLGYLDYLENWNEPDQFDIFSMFQYAAMLSADYDGHGSTLGLVPDPDNPNQMISTVGIKNADPTMKVVLAGLEDANLDSIRLIVQWSLDNRPIGAPLPFDAINIHKYLGNNPDFNLSTAGVSPEAGGLRDFLIPFVTYRDSLMPSVELWLSEFGYDTNSSSKISVPTIGNFTQYEVQGQWLVRSYLETMAAGFDRAMIFDLRDVCTGAFCGTFESAGLLETQFNNFKPKDSWYYVYTMKNILTDLVFDADLSYCTDLSCPRVYRFIDPNNANKRVYAVWSPTSDDTIVNYNLDLEGANAATLVELSAPSIRGIVSPLNGTNPTITVSESPVFVVVGDSFSAGTACTSNLTVTEQTCGSVKVNWDAANGVETFQLWYMEGNQTAADFELMSATLVSDEIPANQLNYTVAGLPVATNLTFFLIPAGVAVNPNNPNAPAICTIQTTTLAAGNSCAIPLDPSMIFDLSLSLANATKLLDEQATVDPFCDPALAPSTFWGFDFTPNPTNPRERLGIDLGAFYDLTILAIYDGGGIGELTIQTAPSPNGPWTTLTVYPTISTNDWVYFTDIFDQNQSIRFLRFIADASDGVQIGELFLCGTLSDNNPDVTPGVIQNAVVSGTSCNTVSLDLVAPFDKDIASYTVSFNGGSQSFPFTDSEQTITISNLPAGVNYNFSVITVNTTGLTSTPLLISAATLPIADCEANCNPDCPNQLCLKPSWITDITPVKPADYDPTRLVDEQNTAPLCGDNTNPVTEWGFEFDPFDGIPPVAAILDLQAEYNLDTVYLFDGNDQGTFLVDYLDENGIWQPLINYFSITQEEWVLFENPTKHARFLRITKTVVTANINEVVIHATPFLSFDPSTVQINDFVFDEVNCDNASLSWTLPVNSSINQLQLIVTTTISKEASLLSATADDIVLNNLRPNTVYECFLIPQTTIIGPPDLDIVTFQTASCGNNCDPNCPTFICVEEAWINDLTASVHLDAKRLFDEVSLGNPICGENGVPVSNWGEDYTPGSGVPPIIAEVDLQQAYHLEAIYLFDIESDGRFRVDYQNSNGDWVELFSYYTAPFNKWIKRDNFNVATRYLRFTKLDNSAKIAEIALFGTPVGN